MTQAPDTIGGRLGPYEITGKLGEGGMGEVYRATDSRLRREVAIKVLPTAFTADRERLARFEREAQTLAALNHPNIAAIYGFEESNGTRALVMELVEGEDLSARIARGPLPLEEALGIARQIAEALEAAHEQGIVHRDLKPANVKVRADGTVKVLDFGLAKAMEPAAGEGARADLAHSPTLTAAHGTRLGVILGTAAYMSPEQARGSAVDERADVWALGVVLWEMLTGRRLFEGETVSDTLAAVLRAEIDLAALPADTPAELRSLLRRCLERNPRNRLHHVADARLVLDDLLAGRGDSGTLAGSIETGAAGARQRRRSAAGWAAAGAAVALVAALGVFVLARRGSDDAAGARAAAAPRPVRFEQLTDATGVETAPSLSPDGRDVVFTRIVDGRPEIMIQRVGARVATSLTAGSGAHDSQPAFSPDGARIAFRSERDGGGIFVMDTSGEGVRRLSDFGFHPTWSPDGRELAIASGNFLFPTDRGGAIRGLWAIDPGERRETGDLARRRCHAAALVAARPPDRLLGAEAEQRAARPLHRRGQRLGGRGDGARGHQRRGARLEPRVVARRPSPLLRQQPRRHDEPLARPHRRDERRDARPARARHHPFAVGGRVLLLARRQAPRFRQPRLEHDALSRGARRRRRPARRASDADAQGDATAPRPPALP